jgi:hypothetical protein
MHNYQVADGTPKGQIVVLRDGADRFHLVRAISVIPQIGLKLCGNPPSLGFHILVAVDSGCIFRIIFERINWSLQAAQDYCDSNVDLLRPIAGESCQR